MVILEITIKWRAKKTGAYYEYNPLQFCRSIVQGTVFVDHKLWSYVCSALTYSAEKDNNYTAQDYIKTLNIKSESVVAGILDVQLIDFTSKVTLLSSGERERNTGHFKFLGRCVAE